MGVGRPGFTTLVAIPACFYFVCFALLTYPAITVFSSHLFSDGGDGMQNLWNHWWVGYAFDHHLDVWFTDRLHFPHGTSLRAHTLGLFNCYPVLALRHFVGGVAAYNTMVVFAFVASGVTAFWLAFYTTAHFRGSLLAGYIFTFCSYHFAHAEGHLNLISMQWIPLFVLAWSWFLDSPAPRRAMASAGALWAVLLCDYYYFSYCVLAGAVMFAWQVRRGLPWHWRQALPNVALFVVSCSALCGPMLWGLFAMSQSGEVTSGHWAGEYSLDLWAPFIPGGHWRFAELTRPYWQRLKGNIQESSVHWGISVIVLAGIGWMQRRRWRGWRTMSVWPVLVLFFAALAMGPNLRAAAKRITDVPGPYALLETLIPPLKMSGCPVRMSIMALLAVAVLAAMGFAALGKSSRGRIGRLVLLGLMIVEYLPSPIPLTPLKMPDYVAAMGRLPRGGVFDTDSVWGAGQALLFQTGHGLPMVGGYVSRVPLSVKRRDDLLERLADSGEWRELCENYGIRYVLRRAGHSLGGDFPGGDPTLSGDGVELFDLGSVWECSVLLPGDAALTLR